MKILDHKGGGMLFHMESHIGVVEEKVNVHSFTFYFFFFLFSRDRMCFWKLQGFPEYK